MLLLAVSVCLITLARADLAKDLHPDAGLDVIELIQRHGYPVEVHDNILTEDGYLLQLHRIPHGLNNADETNKPVVFLMHCLLCSSGIWVTMGPEKALAFGLADLGFDVWMGNARGNKWSRKHVSLDPDVDKSEFWAFSWHGIGYYDVPASIDYVLSQTNENKLFYVGFSQGTTSFFVMASERPEYNDKIRLSVNLGPGVFMYHIDNIFLRVLAEFLDVLEDLMELLGVYEFFPSLEVMDELAELCRSATESGAFCDNIFFLIFGWDSEQIEEWMIPVIVTHVPAGSSTKQFVHYGQLIKTEAFKQFDYGLVGNLNHYGQATPPDYNLSNVVAPVALFVGEKDMFATPPDNEILAAVLPNLVYKELFPYRHMDFMYADNVKETIYDIVYELMKSY